MSSASFMTSWGRHTKSGYKDHDRFFHSRRPYGALFFRETSNTLALVLCHSIDYRTPIHGNESPCTPSPLYSASFSILHTHIQLYITKSEIYRRRKLKRYLPSSKHFEMGSLKAAWLITGTWIVWFLLDMHKITERTGGWASEQTHIIMATAAARRRGILLFPFHLAPLASTFFFHTRLPGRYVRCACARKDRTVNMITYYVLEVECARVLLKCLIHWGATFTDTPYVCVCVCV